MLNKGCFKKGSIPWNKGKQHSDDTRKKISESRQKNPLLGNKNPNYKHGNDWKTLRNIILERDDYTCQECRWCEPDIMQVDHIQPKSIYPELQYELNNLECLCPNCHARKTIKDKKRIALSKKRMNSGELLTCNDEDNPEPSIIGM